MWGKVHNQTIKRSGTSFLPQSLHHHDVQNLPLKILLLDRLKIQVCQEIENSIKFIFHPQKPVTYYWAGEKLKEEIKKTRESAIMHQHRGAGGGNTWQSEASPSLKMPHVSDLTFDGLIITIIIAAIIIAIVKITNINGQWNRQTGRQIIWFLEWAKTARGQLGSKQRMPIVRELVGTSCKMKIVQLLSSS